MHAHIDIADTIIRAVIHSSVWRAMHFAPLWCALAIIAGLAYWAWTRRFS